MNSEKTSGEIIREQIVRDPTVGMELDRMVVPSGLNKIEGISYSDVYNFLSKMNIPFQKESIILKGRGKMALDRLVIVSREYARPINKNFGQTLQDELGNYYQAAFDFDSITNNYEYEGMFTTEEEREDFKKRERKCKISSMGGGFVRLDDTQEKAFQHTYIVYKRYSLIKRVTDVLKANFKFK